MKMRWTCLWLLAFLFLFSPALLTGEETAPEPLVTEDYVFVPAHQGPEEQEGVWLLVKGRTMDEAGLPVEVPALEGVVFGLYTSDAEGTLVPWPDAKDPSRAATVESGNAPVFIPLPQGQSLYLRQLSAPGGYHPADDADVALRAGQEVTLWNVMRGKLVLTAASPEGKLLSGARFFVKGPQGTEWTLETGLDGSAALEDLEPGPYEITALEAPENRLLPEETVVTAQVSDARAAMLPFEFDQMGSLSLRLATRSLTEDGQTVTRPLTGEEITLLDARGRAMDGVAALVTDTTGSASVYLPAGSYQVQVAEAYEGGYFMAEPRYEVEITDGQVTRLSLEAAAPLGGLRVRTAALRDADRPQTPYGSLAFQVEDAGGTWIQEGISDASAEALFLDLTPGEYTLRLLDAPGGFAPAQDEWQVEVMPSVLTEVSLTIASIEGQSYTLLGHTPARRGTGTTEPLPGVRFAVLRDTEILAEGETDDQGAFELELPLGAYTLQFAPGQAGLANYQQEDIQLTMPQEDPDVVLPSALGGLVLRSLDGEEKRLGGAVYRLTDAKGTAREYETDTHGEAVTELLSPGVYHVVTVLAPEGYALLEADVEVTAGGLGDAPLVHPALGEFQLTLFQTAIDAQGEVEERAFPDVTVQLYAKQGRQWEPVLQETPLVSDEKGIVRGDNGDLPKLPQGEYRAQADGDAAQVVEFQMHNDSVTEARLVLPGQTGGLSMRLTDGQGGEPLPGARFVLTGGERQFTLITGLSGDALLYDLPQGEYTLRQARAPKGYSPVQEASVSIEGGTLTQITAENYQEAVLSVEKTGVYYDGDWTERQERLSGEYGLYVLEEGEYRPYPDAQEQWTLLAWETGIGVSATPQGTEYYLRDVEAVQGGYLPDDAYYPVTLHPGEVATVQVERVGDGGFFRLSNVDSQTGEPLSGARFALYAVHGDAVEAEATATWTLETETYHNNEPLPTGEYRLEILRAAQGYMLDPERAQTVFDFEITAYRQDQQMTEIAIQSVRIQETWDALNAPGIHAAQGEGDHVLLSLKAPEAEELPLYQAAQTLGALTLSGENGELEMEDFLAQGELPWTLEWVTLSPLLTADGMPLSARIWLREWQGGWRFWQEVSLAQEQTLSLDTDGAREIRVDYFDPRTGAALLPAMLQQGGVTVSVRVWTPQARQITAHSMLTYTPYVLDETGVRMDLEEISQESASGLLAYAGTEDSTPAPRLAGPSLGQVMIDAWLEPEVLDGLRGASDRTEGLESVRLRLRGSQVYEVSTQEAGRFVWDDLPLGTYVLEVELPEPLRTLSGEGMTLTLTEEGAFAYAELPLYAAAGLSGRLFRDADGDGQPGEDEAGVAEAEVRLMRRTADGEAEVVQTARTDAQGIYAFEGLRPGVYHLSLSLPEPLRIIEEETPAQKAFTLGAGQQTRMPDQGAVSLLSIEGTAWMDDLGDGRMAEEPEPVAQMTVRLYRVADEQGLPLKTTRTGEDGSFAFQDIPPGDYILRLILPEGAVATQQAAGGNQIRMEKAGVGITGPLSLRMDQQTPRILAGLSLPIELTVYSWNDVNYTGRLRSRNEAVPGVDWTLLRHLPDGSMEEAAQQKSDDGGEAVFEEIGPGTYTLRYVLPGGMAPSWAAQEEDGLLLPAVDDWEQEGETQSFTLGARDQSPRLSLALMKAMSISGTVFLDADDSGQRDADEEGFPGVLVEALDEQRQVMASAQTNHQGAYTLSPLVPGRYVVRATLPEGYVFSGSQRTYDRGNVARSDGPVSETMELTLRAGGDLSATDAGALAQSMTQGRVYVAEGSQPGLRGVEITLERELYGRFTEEQTATTDEEGGFAFDALRPGTYRLTMRLPESYVFTEAGDALDLAQGLQTGQAQTASFDVAAGDEKSEFAFGALILCALEGTVWDDINADGLPGVEEPGLRGALLELLPGDGETPLATVTTDRDGRFAFEGLMPETYRLRVTLPEGRVFTFPAQGGSLLPRENALVATLSGLSPERGERLGDLWIGALALSEVTGTVYLDGSDDGRKQSYEEGLPGVQVALVNAVGDVVLQTESDASGIFRFAGLEPASYRILVTLPEGSVFARNPSRTPEKPFISQQDADSGETGAFTVGFGESLRGIEVGAVRTGGFRGRVYDDVLDLGLDAPEYEGVGDVRVTATDLLTGTTYSDLSEEDGAFEIAGLRPGQYALTATLPGGRLFSRRVEGGGAFSGTDASSLTVEPLSLGMEQWMEGFAIGTLVPLRFEGGVFLDENRNGVWDEQEQGLAGVDVGLYLEGERVQEARTGSDGRFAFENQRPGTLHLELTLPERAMYESFASLSIDAEEATLARTQPQAYRAGQVPQGLFAPALQKAGISGAAFEDVDSNGGRDADEPALTGVQVTLLQAGEAPAVLAATEVDEWGQYAFDALAPGEYLLRFTLPEGYLFTTPGGEARHSRVYEEEDGLTGWTQTLSLAMGEEITSLLVGGIRPGLIGDTVWLDENGNGWQDDAEPPVEGVEIVLYQVRDGVATEVARTHSDAYGLYRFSGLRPGGYQIEALLPAGMAFTQVDTALPEINSDIVLLEGASGRTEVFELHSAQQRRDLDIGLVRRLSE